MLTQQKYAAVGASETHLRWSDWGDGSPGSGTLNHLQHAALSRVLTSSPILGPLLARWPTIALPDCWLASGAVSQTVWNAAFALPPDHGLSDIDLVYFDATDLSEDTEARREERLRGQFTDVPLRIDAKNEARVHLWYADKFGKPLAPYTSTEHAISTFPTTATCVGVRPGPDGLAIAAPFGLSDLLGMVVRPNKTQVSQSAYEAKVARWRPLWPGLTYIDWHA